MTRILIVDNDPQSIHPVEKKLASFGYSTNLIAQTELLFPTLDTHPFDLILLNVNMLEINGITLLQLLKQHPEHQHLPVIMTAHDADDALLDQCFEEGASDFISKPVHPHVLNSRITAILAAKESKETLKMLVNEHTVQLEIAYSELERINTAFKLFVPPFFLNRMQSTSFRPGQFQSEKLTILFGDIRAYTNHAEQMEPEENFEFLNQFFSLMVPQIQSQNGFVDKFLGDALLALFDRPQSADDALKSAVAMQKVLDNYNVERLEQKSLPIHFGIGINTGEALIGALGSPTRLNSTVIGDQVNLAARLEELTKKFQARILISHHTYAEIEPEQYLIREVDTVKVRGRSKAVTIYEVFDNDSPTLKEKKLQTREMVSQGIVKYKNQSFSEALECFQQCLYVFPQDIVALEYVRRCRYFQKFPPPSGDQNWDGIVKDSSLLVDHSIRRRTKRYAMHNTPTNIYSSSAESHFAGVVQNLSMSGIQLEMGRPFQAGEILMVEIFFGRSSLKQFLDQKPHNFVGRVVWQRKGQNFNQLPSWKIGIEVVTMTLEQEQSLHEALDELAKK